MTVFRTLDIVLVAIMIGVAGVTYKVKYDAQKRIGDVRLIERQITSEKNSIHLLYAEWAMLTQPSRLQVLAEKYQEQLGLNVTMPRQIVDFKDIPERLPDQIENIIKDNELEDLNSILANDMASSIDDLLTANAYNDNQGNGASPSFGSARP